MTLTLYDPIRNLEPRGDDHLQNQVSYPVAVYVPTTGEIWQAASGYLTTATGTMARMAISAPDVVVGWTTGDPANFETGAQYGGPVVWAFYDAADDCVFAVFPNGLAKYATSGARTYFNNWGAQPDDTSLNSATGALYDHWGTSNASFKVWAVDKATGAKGAELFSFTPGGGQLINYTNGIITADGAWIYFALYTRNTSSPFDAIAQSLYKINTATWAAPTLVWSGSSTGADHTDQPLALFYDSTNGKVIIHINVIGTGHKFRVHDIAGGTTSSVIDLGYILRTDFAYPHWWTDADGKLVVGGYATPGVNKLLVIDMPTMTVDEVIDPPADYNIGALVAVKESGAVYGTMYEFYSYYDTDYSATLDYEFYWIFRLGSSRRRPLYLPYG